MKVRQLRKWVLAGLVLSAGACAPVEEEPSAEAGGEAAGAREVVGGVHEGRSGGAVRGRRGRGRGSDDRSEDGGTSGGRRGEGRQRSDGGVDGGSARPDGGGGGDGGVQRPDGGGS